MVRQDISKGRGRNHVKKIMNESVLENNGNYPWQTKEK